MVESPHVSKVGRAVAATEPLTRPQAHRVQLEKLLAMSDEEIVASAHAHLARALWSRRPHTTSKDLVIIDTVLLRLR